MTRVGAQGASHVHTIHRSARGTVTELSHACRKLLRAMADRTDGRNSERVSTVIDTVVAAIPEMAGEDDLEQLLRVSARDSMAQFAQVLRSDDIEPICPPDSAQEWAIAVARAGLPLSLLLRTLRMMQAAYGRNWSREIVDADAPPPVTLEALTAYDRLSFAWMDAFIAPLVEAFEHEREQLTRDAAMIRTETVRRLLANESIDPDAASARLGYELHQAHLAMVFWSDDEVGGADQSTLQDLLRTVLSEIGDPRVSSLRIRQSSRTAHLWIPAPRGHETFSPRLEAIVSPTRFRVSLGRVAEGPAGFISSHRQALRARRAARLIDSSTRMTRFDEIATIDLLTHDLDGARRFASRELGALANADDVTKRLLEALRTFVSEGESYVRASRRMGVHQNTLAYRVRRALEIAECEGPPSEALRIALLLAPLLESASSSAND